MMDATKGKKAEKGLGNARLVGGMVPLLRRMVREGLTEKVPYRTGRAQLTL